MRSENKKMRQENENPFQSSNQVNNQITKIKIYTIQQYKYSSTKDNPITKANIRGVELCNIHFKKTNEEPTS